MYYLCFLFRSLTDLRLNELLSTFDVHKPHLDKIFQECRNKSNIRQYCGIDHCFVINLIDQRHQMKMLQKLNEIYRKEKNSLVLNIIKCILYSHRYLNYIKNCFTYLVLILACDCVRQRFVAGMDNTHLYVTLST